MTPLRVSSNYLLSSTTGTRERWTYGQEQSGRVRDLRCCAGFLGRLHNGAIQSQCRQASEKRQNRKSRKWGTRWHLGDLKFAITFCPRGQGSPRLGTQRAGSRLSRINLSSTRSRKRMFCSPISATGCSRWRSLPHSNGIR